MSHTNFDQARDKMPERTMNSLPGLRPRLAGGGQVISNGPASWRLEIPTGPAGQYRLAQIDDYNGLERRAFRWHTPMHLTVRGRASAANLPGTWGFGLWNDPFGLGLIGGVEFFRLPALPNAAWFFFASPDNYLSLRDDQVAYGGLAATFFSPRLPTALLAPAAPALPFLFFPPMARWLRRLGRRVVQQESAAISDEPSEWREYRLEWYPEKVILQVDGQEILQTQVAPRGRLGLVIWIDNQYMAIPPNGRVRLGTLPNPIPAWIEVEILELG